MADETAGQAQPKSGMDALRARQAAARRPKKAAKKAEAPNEAAGGAGDRVHRAPPRPLFPKAEPKPAPAEREGAAEAQKPAETVVTAQPLMTEQPEAPTAPAPATDSSAVRDPVKESPSRSTPTDAGERGTSMERRATASPPSPAPSATANRWDRHAPPSGNDRYPRAEEVLNQRFITRESLSASVPTELEIPHRLQLLKVFSQINHIPQADLVAVAVDWFLRGGKPSSEEMLPPWNGYIGPGTREHIRRAEDVLNERFITRESLKAQVPADLQLGHRLAMYRLLNRLDRMPVADIVTVALDRWLRVMGF